MIHINSVLIITNITNDKYQYCSYNNKYNE